MLKLLNASEVLLRNCFLAFVFVAWASDAVAADKKDAPPSAKKDVAADINAPRADARKLSLDVKEARGCPSTSRPTARPS
jgi:hypothetical protein